MKITFYQIIFLILSSFLLSCNKGVPISDPQFGQLAIANQAGNALRVIQGESLNVAFDNNGNTLVSVPAQRSRYRIYLGEILSKDTTLFINPYVTNRFATYISGNDQKVDIVNDEFHGLKKELIPDSGQVKVSIANHNTTLPDQINIDILTTTDVANNASTILAGQINGITRSFSPYKGLMIGRTSIGKNVTSYTLNIKDPADGRLLKSVPLTMPVTIDNNIAGKIFLIYLDGSMNATVLLSK